MRTPHALTVALCAAMLAFAATASAAAAPELREDGDKFVLENEHVTIWFQGKKPMLKVFPAALAGNESAGYGYKLAEVVEYRDLDGDGAPTQPEVVARLNLEKASAYEVERVETDGSVVLNLTLRAPVTLGKPAVLDQDLALPDREAVVSFVFTLRSETVTLEASGANVTVPATSVKYDFVVAQWPFVDAQAHRLALETIVTGTLDSENLTLEGDAVGGATVQGNETAVGALTWLNVASGTLENGTEVEVPVKTKIAAQGNATRVTHTYDAAGLATLLHDPTVGVISAEGLDDAALETIGDKLNTVPAPGLALGLAAVGTAAAIMIGRRR